ncbi:MAG: hypothetical protein KF819_23855 [Labilithrix sp.]|nr:hypothetical protein [Labilithrix sp.]
MRRSSATKCDLSPTDTLEPREDIACRVPINRGKYELAGGFDVDELDFKIESPQGTANVNVAWIPPERARTVTCALFSCLPEFSTKEHEGTTRPRLVTLDHCVLASETFNATSREITLAQLTRRKEMCPIEQTEGRKECVPAILEQLSIGCWAYDDIKVIAATRLESVDPQRSFVAARFAADCKQQGAEGKSCVFADQSPFGTCLEGDCLARCLSPDDCAGAPLTAEPIETSSDAGIDAATADVDAEVDDTGDASDASPDGGANLCRHTCRGKPKYGDFRLCEPKKPSP